MSATYLKSEVRAYMKRIREDLREIEQAMKDGDLDYATEMANDVMGAAAEITTIFDYAQGDAPYGYAPDGTRNARN